MWTLYMEHLKFVVMALDMSHILIHLSFPLRL